MIKSALASTLMFAALVAAGPAAAQLKASDNPEASVAWKKVRAELFAAKPIAAAPQDMMEVDAPPRAEDASIVPIAVKMHFPQNAGRYVSKLYLVIDNNPSPVAAVIRFTQVSGRADIETRVRIDDYTHVRAIVEMNDGKLFMTSQFVKAAGGCSAPSARNQAAAMASLGRIKFRVEGSPEPGRPVLAQLMISHPNSSGLVMDPVANKFIPANYVRHVEVSYAGQPVMSADLDNSISENPNLRFYFVPQAEGELKAEIIDSNDLRFYSAVSVAKL